MAAAPADAAAGAAADAAAAAAAAAAPSSPVLTQQPGAGPFLRRLAKRTFDTYVPPHVQQRKRSWPTRADAQAFFRQHIQLPGLPIRHWARRYTSQVGGWGLGAGGTRSTARTPYSIQARLCNRSIDQLTQSNRPSIHSSIHPSIHPYTTKRTQRTARQDLFADLIGGFTVAVMLVPQGLAVRLHALKSGCRLHQSKRWPDTLLTIYLTRFCFRSLLQH